MVESLLRAARSYLPDLNEDRLREAFEFAREAHEAQMRKDGTPYITHPLAAAMHLTALHVDEDTLVSTLLHDVPEDTERTLEEIKEKFGPKVEFLVNGITKLSKVHYRNEMEERQIESLKKLFLHCAKDPRIILIKLADRLHNMETLDAIPKPEKRERIARETLEIFVPIANLLGIWELKNQLEDHCFRILLPMEYKEISGWVLAATAKRQDILKKTAKKVQQLLKAKGVKHATIEGRQKNHYSIYRKMLRSTKSFHEIYDLIGMRILVEDVGTCYQVLGILHQNFTPKIGRLKDYIAIPKNNGYQSIHTTVFGMEGMITEFQIRTMEMHLENEYGIAAHYFYSQKDQKKQKQMQKKVAKKYEWVQEILDMQRNSSNNKKFMEDLKLDIFEDRIFVFTPKGDVVDLPVGSTCIDFAYQIHSDLGMVATEAEVNGKTVPLATTLQNGDTVYIVTSEESDGPAVEWLDYVHTNLARSRIREFLKEKDRTSLISQAENVLEQKLRILGLPSLTKVNSEQKISALSHFGLESWEDLLNQIGNGLIEANDLFSVLFSDEEVLGARQSPFYSQAYEQMPRRQLTSRPVEQVHYITLVVEGSNRIGMLRDLCKQIADSGVNILEIESLPRKEKNVARIEFVMEIRDFKQYDVTIRAIRGVAGVFNVLRLQTPESMREVLGDAHTELSQ